MKNVPPEKYNVAWFKLAECVSRGEKERALGVYRLLAHSLHDSAFARQLQGDILIAFNDTLGGIEHYKAAAKLYQLNERFLEAAAVYEHIVILASDKKECLITLISLYKRMNNAAKIAIHVNTLCALYLAQHMIDAAFVLLEEVEPLLSEADLIALQQQCVCAALSQETFSKEQVMPHITRLVDYLAKGDDHQALHRFVTMVQSLDEACYAQICAQLNQ